ncbi:IS1096 element passenger TnpR family protein [Arthrobacter methylotrophus]|uniref:Plasmid pRiA4b Orf3-like domain-containing protein n=1 Tax=Arthrobacter methylotrophus TaxID=121291 RepID=A0ABV5UQW7_9MICC
MRGVRLTETDPPPRPIAGARRGPLEDSGGLPGYGEILDVLPDSADPNQSKCRNGSPGVPRV